MIPVALGAHLALLGEVVFFELGVGVVVLTASNADEEAEVSGAFLLWKVVLSKNLVEFFFFSVTVFGELKSVLGEFWLVKLLTPLLGEVLDILSEESVFLDWLDFFELLLQTLSALVELDGLEELGALLNLLVLLGSRVAWCGVC